MEYFKLMSFVVQLVLLFQIPNGVLSHTQTFHDLETSSLKIITPVMPVDSNVIDIKQSSTSGAHKRVTRQSGSNGFSYNVNRNIPGIGDFKISVDNKGINFSYGRPTQTQGQDQLQTIINVLQGMGNSVLNMFRGVSSTAPRTFMDRFNESIQRWMKAFGNLAQSNSDNQYTYTKGNQQPWEWQASWND